MGRSGVGQGLMLLGGRAVFPGLLGAPECFRAGPMGRDEAQQGAGGVTEELRAEERLSAAPMASRSQPPSPSPSPQPLPTLGRAGCSRSLRGIARLPSLQVSLVFLFLGHRLPELKVHLTGVNI